MIGNTSAMIETAILNKPCITILNEKYQSSIGLNPQKDFGHFKLLSEAKFIYKASNNNEAIKILKDIMNGNDKLVKNRMHFVKNFIRPNGIDKNVSNIISDDIIKLLNKSY